MPLGTRTLGPGGRQERSLTMAGDRRLRALARRPVAGPALVVPAPRRPAHAPRSSGVDAAAARRRGLTSGAAFLAIPRSDAKVFAGKGRMITTHGHARHAL